jgi:hypothetical protein
LAMRYPLSLAEMHRSSSPPGMSEATPLARWGIECHSGWRRVIESLLGDLEAAIMAQPPERRHAFRIVQMKEKFGRICVYLAGEGTSEMKMAIDAAVEQSTRTCEICSAAGGLAERRSWWSVRCEQHQDWMPHDRLS